jgi:hypothetical protein
VTGVRKTAKGAQWNQCTPHPTYSIPPQGEPMNTGKEKPAIVVEPAEEPIRTEPVRTPEPTETPAQEPTPA